MTALPSHRCKQRARRAKHCPISRGWWLTTDRQSAWTAVVHCRPRSVWRHYECRQDWQVDASTHGTVAYLLHVLPYVGLVRMFTRHCRSVISRWLVTTVTLLVAVRHQFMWPVVGVCCLCSGQQYSPPSLHCSRHSLLLPRPASHSLQSTAAVNGMRGGEGQVPASAVDSRLRLLDSVTGFWEMKPDTALKNGYRLPFYNLNSNI